MKTLAQLSNKLEKFIKASEYLSLENEQLKSEIREQFIQSVYTVGGAGFLERVQKYARTEKDEPVRLRRWYREYLLAIADFRLNKVLTTGPAQCGKTIGHIMLYVDTLTSGKLNGAWFFDSRTALHQNVPMQFIPMVDSWVANMIEDGIKFNRYSDVTKATLFQIDGVNAIFSYVSTSRPSTRQDGRAAAGAAAVSFQADYLFLEERSQYPPGSADALPRRLDASVLPTRPIRELGTPGGGSGIEAQMGQIDHLFYPHIECSCCGEIIPLDPKGCLLKPVQIRDAFGKVKTSYFSESGRPGKWFHEDEDDPITSSYFACSSCGTKIEDEERVENAHFRCRQTHVTLQDFLDSLPSGFVQKNHAIGIHLSPLTRETHFNLAERIIREGFSAIITNDWQQQMLGHTNEANISNLTVDLIRPSIGMPIPARDADITIAGIDVGRSEDWLQVVKFWLPPNYWQLTPAQVSEQTIRQIVFAEDVFRLDIPDLLARLGVDYGFIDNEPSRESSMNLCRDSNGILQMANQVGGLREIVQWTTVYDGGLEFECWNIRNEKFMNSVLEGFIITLDDGLPLYRTPASWDTWIGNPSDRSPIRHLCGPSRDAKTQKWQRRADKIDDLFFALVFVEAAFYIWLQEQMQTEEEPPTSYSYSSF